MGKSQINQLSKRQILESLMQEQNQSSVTLSRLITAVARTANVDPLKLADMFVDDKGNQEYVEKFNTAVRQKHTAAHKPEIEDTNAPQDLNAADLTTKDTAANENMNS